MVVETSVLLFGPSVGEEVEGLDDADKSVPSGGALLELVAVPVDPPVVDDAEALGKGPVPRATLFCRR